MASEIEKNLALEWGLFDLRVFWFAVAAFVIPFFIYFINLTPTIAAGDSGELVSAAYFLGIPHPPGYPLYCLFGKLFITLIPFGDIGWRVNVMSAFFAAMAGVFLFATLWVFLKDEETSLLGAVLFCFSNSFWTEALQAEVYTMNIFFMALLLWLAARWEVTRNKKYFFIFALAAGLAIIGHQTIITILPAFFLWVFYYAFGRIGFRDAVKFLGLFLLSLLVYLYLPIRSFAKPTMDWGLPHNLYLFLAHILRLQYYGINPVRHKLAVYLRQIYEYGKMVFEQWPPVYLAVAAIGVVVQFQKKLLRPLILLASFIMSSFILIYFTNYNVDNILQIKTQEVFYLISFVFLAIWMAYGFRFLVVKLKELYRVREVILKLFLFSVGLSLFLGNLPRNLQSRNYIACDYGKNILRTCKKNAVLWVTGDVQVFSLTYVKLVLGLRPDVTVYDSKRIIFGDQYGFLLWPMISLYHPPLSFCGTVENETHKWGRPVYYGWYKTKQEMPGWWLCPNGLLYRVFPEGYRWRPPENFLKIYNVRGLWDKTAPKDFLDEEIASHYEKTLTEYILTELGQIFLAKNDLKKAKEAFIKALRFAPDFVPAYEGLIEIAKRSNDHQAWQYCLSRIEKIEKDYGY